MSQTLPCITRVATNTTFDVVREENHVNISRYIDGTNPKERRKKMQEQLRNLSSVNYSPTLPNLSSTRPLSDRVLFSKIISKVR